jgi:hypothetical protein
MYVTSLDSLELSFHQFADPYVQRPTALQRLFLCPTVDGYGGDRNSLYAGPGDARQAAVASPHQLALAPVQAYAIRLEPAALPAARLRRIRVELRAQHAARDALSARCGDRAPQVHAHAATPAARAQVHPQRRTVPQLRHSQRAARVRRAAEAR